MKKKRVLLFVLTLALLLSLWPLPMAGAAGTSYFQGESYSTDYTTWRQTGSPWSSLKLGDEHTMGGYGCYISAIAILMCYSGAYDPAYMNPGVLLLWLDSKGLISHNSDRNKDGLLQVGGLTSSVCPRFYYVNQASYSAGTSLTDIVTKIKSLQSQGYSVIAKVKNGGHYTAVAKTVGSSDARLYDSAYSPKSLLSEYNGTITGLVWFKANTAGKDTIAGTAAAKTTSPEESSSTTPTTPSESGTSTVKTNPNTPGVPQVEAMKSVYGTGDTITVSWKAAAKATHYNVYVDTQKSDGTWENFTHYKFYCTSPYTLPALAGGTYRLRVQSTNANDKEWPYADSAYQNFTVKSGYLTVAYDANGGTVSPSEQLVTVGGAYDLPTPTRSDKAFFLGWYTTEGDMVTNTARVGSKGHTLKAKWEPEGHAFTLSSNKANFRDVAATAWYYDSVQKVYAYGFMTGTSADTFAPTENVTAAQTVTMAARLNKIYETGNGTFSNSNPWYKSYLDYALKEEVIPRAPTSMDATLTRREFCWLISEALPEEALPQVNDVPYAGISDLYRSDVEIYDLYRAGILAGTDSAGTFRPNDTITRAEVAAILVRIADPNSRILFTLKN